MVLLHCPKCRLAKIKCKEQYQSLVDSGPIGPNDPKVDEFISRIRRELQEDSKK